MKEQIQSLLQESCLWQDSLIWLPTVDSTNTRIKALAKQGAPHGTVLIADQQTGGRGRLGRSFHSPAGNGIYMSVLLRPGCIPGEIMHLTCAAAVAVADALRQAVGLDVGIKWTNDLVIGQRKLGGILTELGLTPDGRVDYAVIGAGINCCQKPEDFPPEIRPIATSVSHATGASVSRAGIAAAMMDGFFRMDRHLLSGRSEILRQYRRQCITLGQNVSILRGDSVRHGRALDLDENGALVVALDSGIRETVNSGEVSIRGMYGYV